jgi:hypothetical protein
VAGVSQRRIAQKEARRHAHGYRLGKATDTGRGEEVPTGWRLSQAAAGPASYAPPRGRGSHHIVFEGKAASSLRPLGYLRVSLAVRFVWPKNPNPHGHTDTRDTKTRGATVTRDTTTDESGEEDH